jgi:hypothetical protein
MMVPLLPGFYHHRRDYWRGSRTPSKPLSYEAREERGLAQYRMFFQFPVPIRRMAAAEANVQRGPSASLLAWLHLYRGR